MRPCSSRVYSLEKHAELGIQLRAPVVITNAVDPAIFHPPDGQGPGRRPSAARDRVELVAEPAEGRGRACLARPRARPVVRDRHVRGPVAAARSSGFARSARSTPHGVARLLREHDVYLAASRDDPCSNALLEALACGLPAAYLDSGGHPELVGEGGVPFRSAEDVPDALTSLAADLDGFRSHIRVPSLRLGGGRVPQRPRARRRGVALESLPVQNYVRRAVRSARFRLDRRLDRAAVSRAHDVLYESDAWTHATWLGTQALKNPLDLWVYQEIMVETKPELIVETGTYRGGSAHFLASLCDLMGRGEVVSIDIEPRRDDYPEHPRITYLAGARPRIRRSSTRCASAPAGRPILVILDSDHSQAHVEAELAAYAPLVPVGCYVIVEDSNIGRIRKDLMPGPLEAVETFLAQTDEFEIDREREKFLITFNPSGYLRRVR